MTVIKKIKKTVAKVTEFTFDTLTNSARSTFLNCRKKFYWQYIRRLTPIKPSTPLLVGSLFHDGLELFYGKGLDIEEYRLVVQKKLEEQMSLVSNDEESSRLWQQEALVMGMLTAYVKRYSKQDKEKWKVIAPETDFVFQIPGSPLKYAGKRDLLVELKKDKSTVLVEHKTTGRLDAGYLAKLPLDNQILNYANSVLIETGKLPKHIVYNVIQKLAIRQKQSETLQQFYDRMLMEYDYNLEKLFYREIIPVQKNVVMDAAEELCKCANEVQRCITTGYYYMNTTQCTQYGTCPYMSLCTKTKDAEFQFTIRETAHAELNIEG